MPTEARLKRVISDQRLVKLQQLNVLKAGHVGSCSFKTIVEPQIGDR